MITQQDKFNIINNLKSHTEFTVNENQKKLLPVFDTGRVFNTNKYRYNDTWYGYTLSADEPEKVYGIIHVDNLPYKSLFNRGSTEKCFISRLDRMVFLNEVEPFMLFINRRFVKWDDIYIIHDYDDTYLRIHGYKYNFFDISDIKIVVLPFKIGYVGTESDYLFNKNFNALHEYIQSSAEIINDKLHIDVPLYKTDYMYNNEVHNIGAWMYNQLRLRYLGLLSEDRIRKLRAINVDKYVYDENDNPIDVYNTIFNIFDTDSYDWNVYESLCNLPKSKSRYQTQALFRFNDDGLLDENGNTMICLVDTNTLRMNQYSSNDNIIYNIQDSIDNIINKDNYMVFKNGLLCTDYDISFKMCNTSKIDVTNTTEYTEDGKIIQQTENNSTVVKVFYNDSIEKIENNNFHFTNNTYKNQISYNYIVNGTTDKDYLDMFEESLDFRYWNYTAFNTNYSEGLNKIIEYNPSLFNPIYKTYVHSDYMTGSEVNATLDKRICYVDRYGLKVPRMKYEDHETYAMVFVNGVLIDRYYDMLVYPNVQFIPVDEEFNDDDTIEFLYFLNCNNNELSFVYDDTDEDIFDTVIPEEDLKLFSTEVDDLLEYHQFEYDLENIAFPVYERDENNKIGVIDEYMNGKNVIAVSSKKFVYQHLVVDRKAYKILLGQQFRYCDNQRQYWLFINGRRVLDDTFLITIPKVTRPFDHMYLYTTKFVNPEDRIELFYVPIYFANMNEDYSIEMQENGYIETDRLTLDVPYSNELYMYFINGKKICPKDILNVSTNMVRITKDLKTTHTLVINNTVIENMPEVTDYIKDSTKESKLDTMINYIKDNFGYGELDILFNQYTQMTDIEDNALVRFVARIAIINEIIRDFWVTSGYEYQDNPFIYDYEMDEFLVKDPETGVYTLPSLDATKDINIIKYGLHHLYFTIMDDMPEYFEIGTVIENPIYSWEYNDNYNTQTIDWQRFDDIDLNKDLRQYQTNEIITRDTSHTIYASNGYNDCETTINIKFCNGIYYGFIDEDLIDNKNSDIYHDDPDRLLHDITKSIQPTADLDLLDVIINNNRYFIYALPKRLIYDADGKMVLSFYLPDLSSDEVKLANNDDKTTPVLTNGDMDQSNCLIDLEEYKMEVFTEFNYTNDSGYTEPYVVYKSNGYFTRLYDETKFNINIRGEIITNMFSK